ncbi:MAG: mannose-1-phosphate guanylyltransferase/mannose-6-phosphate isomerase [Desulfovibrionaceae bacterium]
MDAHEPSGAADILPVVLCGGRGTRLWPLSRELYPKQFIEFGEGGTLLSAALSRVSPLSGGRALVVCNQEHRFLAAQEMLRVGVSGGVVLEPQGRDTAPAAAVAALLAEPEQVLLVLPADHRLAGGEPFERAVARGAARAREGAMVCIGVRPRAPETGYGYLHVGEELEPGVFSLRSFVEKPDAGRAEAFVNSGEYFWNCGMFMFTARTFLGALERLAPQMLAACRQAVDGAAKDMDFLRLDPASFAACPADSIDYAVMEKTPGLFAVELEQEWSDLGSWGAVHESGDADQAGNVLVGDVIQMGSSNCYLHSTDCLVAALGVRDLVVVETGDAVFVAARDGLAEIKALVAELSARGRSEALTHPVVHRPWGSYQTIAQAERFQVKRIVVKPGARLSLQLHRHRAEHWVVVRGTALVTNGDEERMLTEDQSTYIPLGNVHRLENPGKIPLELIEVQTGSYLGEDDIERLDDVYGRKGEIPRG